MTEFKDAYIELLAERLLELDRVIASKASEQSIVDKAKVERLSVAKEMQALAEAPIKSAQDQVALTAKSIVTALAVGNGAAATLLLAALLRNDGASLGIGGYLSALFFLGGGVLASIQPLVSMYAASGVLRSRSSESKRGGSVLTIALLIGSFIAFAVGTALVGFAMVVRTVSESAPEARLWMI